MVALKGSMLEEEGSRSCVINVRKLTTITLPHVFLPFPPIEDSKAKPEKRTYYG